MAIIDNKGRLFGKVNLLDLAVVLVVLAVAVRFGYQYVNPTSVLPEGEDKIIEVTMLLPQVRQPTVDQMKVGATVVESKTANVMGKIVDVKTQPAKVSGPAGEYESKYTVDALVTIRGNGRITKSVTMLNGLEMWIGGANFLVVGEWKGTGTTWDINQNPPERK